MTKMKIGLVVVGLLSAVACGDSGDGDSGDTAGTNTGGGATAGSNSTGDSAGTNGDSAGTNGSTGSGTNGSNGSNGTTSTNNTTAGDDDGGTTGGECAGGPEVDPMSSVGDSTTGTIKGKLTVGVAPGGGLPKAGDLYIAVLESFNLITQQAGASVAQTLVHCVDLKADGAEYEFEIQGVPPRAEAYKLSGFLDVNGNATTAAEAGPDGCDPLNLPSDVTVSSATTVEANLNLNLTLPTSPCM